MKRFLGVVFFALVFAAAMGAGSIDASPVDVSPVDVSQGAVVGTAVPFEIVPDLRRLERHPDGGATWRHRIERPGAALLKLRFADVDLAPGDELVVLDAAGRAVERITGSGPVGANGRFWGLSVPGDRLVLELRLAPGSPTALGAPPFRTTRLLAPPVESLDALFPAAGETKSVCSPADFEDAACYEADAAKWANARATAGVLAMVGDSAVACTGVLVSPRDAVLTSETCLPDAAACADAEFVFGRYRPGCGDGSPPLAWTAYRCAETLETSPFLGCDPAPGSLDFALHRAAPGIDGAPSSTWGWADPDPTPLASGEALYIPQYAGGRPLEIVHGSGADVVVDGSTLRYYGTLDTESTSVGAPIFREADDRLVGLHHCGGCSSPGVGNRGVLMEEIEPLIAEHLCESALLVEPVDASSFEALSSETLSFEALTGNGDAVLDPGETWRFTPTARNAACAADTTAVEATFQAAAGSAPITLLDTVSTFGDLDAGERAEGTPIRFRVDAAAPCAGEARIDWTSISTGGGSFPGADGYVEREIGSVPRTVLLEEDFASASGTTPPAGWSIDDGGTGVGEEGSTWVFDDPGERQLLEAPFAIVDSEFLGPGFQMDESLRPPAVDASAFTGLLLRFRHVYRFFDGGLDERADVDVRSSATGGAWTNVASFTDADASGTVEVDLSTHLAADVEVRFRYSNAEWEWWWAVDDIELLGDTGRACSPPLFADGFESGDASRWSIVLP